MRKLLSNIIMPLPLLALLLVFAVLFYLYGKKKITRALVIAALVWFILITTPFLPYLLVNALEQQYPVYEPKEGNKQINILVLGGGHTNDERLPANDQLSETALARLSEGIRILNLTQKSTLITSGWSGKRESVAQAEVLANAAILLGTDAARIKKQTLPANTLMEAMEYKRLFGDTTTLVLVTSAIHMPRAMLLFQKAGLKPIPAPTNHLFKKGTKRDPWFWLPSSNNIRKTESAILEYARLLWYTLGVE